MRGLTDTICAPATVAGTGAIGIVRISGEDAIAVTGKLLRCRKGSLGDARTHTLKYAEVLCPDGSVLDEVVAAVFRGPHSYTGEDSVELYCHASSYIMERLLEMLVAAGSRIAEPGEFTQRAFVHGRMDLSQAEAVADVIGATSEVEHRVAVNQMRGGYSGELRSLRDRLVELAALLELELDFSEEEVEFADRGKLRGLASGAEAHCRRLADSFRLGNALKGGVPVAIVGAPNSGKSTLLNALLGEERAIVTDIPGTTRDSIEETCVIDGVRFRFIDTAGIRESDDIVERLGIERALAELGKANIVIGMVDGSLPEDEVRAAAGQIRRLTGEGQKLIIAVNKADISAKGLAALIGKEGGEDCSKAGESGLAAGSEGDELTKAGCRASGRTVESGGDELTEGCGGESVIAISAKNGSGLSELRGLLAASIGSHGTADTLVTNARHAAALSAAADSLSRVLSGLDASIPGDLLAEDLRAAISALSGILGEEISADEVLGEIFGKFCIGK